MSLATSILASERIFPLSKPNRERTVSLSLLDSITVDFLPACAAWLFQAPSQQVDWPEHLRHCLRITLDAYPHWCGHLGLFTNISEDIVSGSAPKVTGSDAILPNNQRYGRVYARYGTPDDPGVEFTNASSTTTLDAIYPASRTQSQPLWSHENFSLAQIVPSQPLSNPMKPIPGPPLPVMNVQLTRFACSGFALSVRCAHPLADAQALIHFVKNWASISQSVLSGSPQALPFTPIFDPAQLDAMAAGDINASKPNPAIIEKTHQLPFHRYDWWIPPTDGSTFGPRIPPEYQNRPISPAGLPIPWAEWDKSSPVSHYTIHFTHSQIETLYRRANNTNTSPPANRNPGEQNLKISRHDAILAHVWNRIIHARNQQTDPSSIHCDLTLGIRPPLNLPATLLGSLVIMTNIEIAPASTITPNSSSTSTQAQTATLAHHIRHTIARSTRHDLLTAFLHRLAFEDSPQRIWQGFLGSRHLMVTSWARAGLYEVDFGAGWPYYAEGGMSLLDGLVVIQDGPRRESTSPSGGVASGWTRDGVDVSVRLRTADMERLLRDEELFGGL